MLSCKSTKFVFYFFIALQWVQNLPGIQQGIYSDNTKTLKPQVNVETTDDSFSWQNMIKLAYYIKFHSIKIDPYILDGRKSSLRPSWITLLSILVHNIIDIKDEKPYVSIGSQYQCYSSRCPNGQRRQHICEQILTKIILYIVQHDAWK